MNTAPKIAIFAPPSFLAIELVKELIKLHCLIFPRMYANNWKSKLSHPNIFFEDIGGYDYSIAIGDFPAPIDSRIPLIHKSISTQVSEASKASEKLLLILPFVTTTNPSNHNFPEALKTLYIGEVCSPVVSLDKNSIIMNLLTKVAKGEQTDIPLDTTLYPISPSTAINAVIKTLFSYWHKSPPKIAATPILVSQVLESLSASGITVSVGVPKPHKFFTADTQDFLDIKPDDCVVTTAKSLKTKHYKEPSQPRPKSNLNLSIKIGSHAKIILLGLFLLTTSLFAPFFFSLGTLAVGVASAKSYDFERATLFLKISESASLISVATFSFGAKIPLVGKVFSPLSATSDKLTRGLGILKRGVKVGENLTQLFQGVMGKESYNLDELSKNLHIETARLYEETSFFQSDLENGFSGIYLPTKEEWQYGRRYLDSLSKLSLRLPSVIASNGRKTYAVLFQNNMELRPTGGFIGSFALVTFENGKLIDTQIYDVYTADGQLKGHIEPPAPIKSYLGEANWYLRDSNWDPDFSASAARAEWFLDKELDRKIDGVVAIDLEVVKGMLKTIGNINLPDFNLVVDDKNLYEKLQFEVESNFFPGSQKKANIITSLTRKLTEEILSLSKGKVDLARSIFDSLNTRHIQVYLKDEESAQILKEIGWDGAIEIPECLRSCQKIWSGVVDANVGVNKANYYIKRSLDLDVSLAEKYISHTLTMNLKNESTANLSLGGRYKSYSRALALTGSTFDEVLIIDPKGNQIKKDPEVTGFKDRVEAGVIIDVPPGETRQIVWRWTTPTSLDFRSSGQALLYHRKQAGTDADPFTLRIHAPTTLYSGGPALTKGQALEYNTNLKVDFKTVVNW